MNFSLPSKVANNQRFGVKKLTTDVFVDIFGKGNGWMFLVSTCDVTVWRWQSKRCQVAEIQFFSNLNKMFASRTDIEARNTHFYMSTIAAHHFCNHIFDILKKTHYSRYILLLIFKRTHELNANHDLHNSSCLVKKKHLTASITG